MDNQSIGIFENQKVSPPVIDLIQNQMGPDLLGEATPSGEKHIYVDLTKQRLYAYEGSELFMEAPISSGKWYPTPTGDFIIWSKIRSTRMSGGSGADYYNLPNVPFVQFFYNSAVAKNRGFGLHGAYWHNNFGHAMSHGCVNMREIDAKKLYQWTNPPTNGNSIFSSDNNPGTKVTIFGEAP